MTPDEREELRQIKEGFASLIEMVRELREEIKKLRKNAEENEAGLIAKEKNRLRQQKYRERNVTRRVTLHNVTNNVTPSKNVTLRGVSEKRNVTQKEKERSKERESTECDELVLETQTTTLENNIIGRSHERQPTNWDVFAEYCIKKGCSHEEAIYYFSTWEASGWTTNNQPIKDWRAKVVSWHTAGYFKKNGTLPNR